MDIPSRVIFFARTYQQHAPPLGSHVTHHLLLDDTVPHRTDIVIYVPGSPAELRRRNPRPQTGPAASPQDRPMPMPPRSSYLVICSRNGLLSRKKTPLSPSLPRSLTPLSHGGQQRRQCNCKCQSMVKKKEKSASHGANPHTIHTSPRKHNPKIDS